MMYIGRAQEFTIGDGAQGGAARLAREPPDDFGDWWSRLSTEFITSVYDTLKHEKEKEELKDEKEEGTSGIAWKVTSLINQRSSQFLRSGVEQREHQWQAHVDVLNEEIKKLRIADKLTDQEIKELHVERHKLRAQIQKLGGELSSIKTKLHQEKYNEDTRSSKRSKEMQATDAPMKGQMVFIV